MEKEMGLFEKFINSFYNFKAYNEFKKQSIEKAIVYTLIVSLIFTTISSIFTSIKFVSTAAVITKEMKTKLPDFEFKNGVLHVDSTVPIEFTEGNTIFVIDTTGSTSAENLSGYSTYFLLTVDSFIYSDVNSSGNLPLNTFSAFTITKQTAETILHKLLTTGLIMSIICSPILAFIGKLLNSFTIMGLAGLALSAIMDKKLKYVDCAKLSMYALTVPFALKTILKVFSLNLPGFTLIYFAIAILYLGFGIKALEEEQDNAQIMNNNLLNN